MALNTYGNNHAHEEQGWWSYRGCSWSIHTSSTPSEVSNKHYLSTSVSMQWQS